MLIIRNRNGKKTVTVYRYNGSMLMRTYRVTRASLYRLRCLVCEIPYTARHDHNGITTYTGIR